MKQITQFFGRCECNFNKHLDQQNFLQLSVDGPSVNWNVLDIVSEKELKMNLNS